LNRRGLFLGGAALAGAGALAARVFETRRFFEGGV
jgi:hypothetical protein